MARLYLRHEPQDVEVMVGVPFIDNEGINCHSFQISAAEAPFDDLCYICFMHNGECWAARRKDFFSGGKRISYVCVLLEDQPCVAKMRMIDFLLS